MFRKGGSTGGITSGLREGFANGGYPNPHLEDITTVEGVDIDTPSEDYYINKETITDTDTDDTSTEKPDSDFLRGLWDAPELPKSTAGSDFLMNMGLNLMSGPSTGNIWSNIGEAGKEPLGQFQKARAGERALKYQASQAERRFQLDIYKAMNDEDKLKVQREMEWYMSKSGGNMSKEDAFNAVMYRKPMHPKEQERKDKETVATQLQADLDSIINKYNPKGDGISLNTGQARKVKDFEEWADANKKRYISDEAVIDIEDFNPDNLETDEVTQNKVLPDGTDLDRYIPGYHYLDVTTGILYQVSESGAELIVVDMVSG
jgi:hypothetical protein